jgi:Heparinase II/III-like protein
LNLWAKFDAYRQLGWRSIRDVFFYRARLKIGLHPAQHIRAPIIPDGDFFEAGSLRANPPAPADIWREGHWAFGYQVAQGNDGSPDWHANLLTGKRMAKPLRRWDKIAAFDEELGDIKTVWEASRFDWALSFAQQAACGSTEHLARLNQWTRDWVIKNPAYIGPNWICGQEASLRLIHLILAATILGQDDRPSAALEALLLMLLRRIKPTIAYARGQDNNHATSEGMALFVGGLWLSLAGSNDEIRQEGADAADAGRALLEERAEVLIFADGGFAQYSITYHRLMLDSLSLSEYYRARWNAPSFSSTFYAKAAAASNWLAHFTGTETGDAPNFGSNDGAFLLPIGSGSYRDFRPSCALASTLFEDGTCFADAPSATSLLAWLRLETLPAKPQHIPACTQFEQSGIISLKQGETRLYLRLPGTRFRPHQADALHLDLWSGAENLLQDAGTYSYAETGWDYYPSTAAHNTVCFDRRDQMPRIGRFLYGKWLRRGEVKTGDNWASAEYRDDAGNSHHRHVAIESEAKVIVTDTIDGAFDEALLSWRLPDQAFQLEGNRASNSRMTISIEAVGEPNLDLRLEMGQTSLFYLQSKEILALKARFSRPAIIRSTLALV